MFSKILVANRGEVAVRIIRACKELGIRTVAVCSEVDRDALHTKIADECICIGPNDAKKSYLNMFAIISAAVHSGVDAIHPGYGFLSENTHFANICEESKIKFIGPSSESIKLMGHKVNSRNCVEKLGYPVIVGINNLTLESVKKLDVDKKIGFPVMIKAVAGGGGRGIRIVENDEELYNNITQVQTEAEKYFNDGTLFIEKYVKNAKHIEIQILADAYGNVVHLGERECSVQRKNQKMIEECPSSVLSDEMRKEMGEVAVNIAKEINYCGVGTVEFLVDEDMSYYFLEMNTRIQVEHPVTEMVTGLDLVQEQIKVAAGHKLIIQQEDIKIKGHSIECRINADDTDNNFMPQSGRIDHLVFPGGPGVRVDSGIYNNCYVPCYYDSMLAKIIVHADSRTSAIDRMKRALQESEIRGVKSNIDYHCELLSDDEFVSGKYTTQLISKRG